METKGQDLFCDLREESETSGGHSPVPRVQGLLSREAATVLLLLGLRSRLSGAEVLGVPAEGRGTELAAAVKGRQPELAELARRRGLLLFTVNPAFLCRS